MGTVISMFGEVCDPVEPDDVLERAKGLLDHVVVIGWDKDAQLHIESSEGTAEMSLLIDVAKAAIIETFMCE